MKQIEAFVQSDKLHAVIDAVEKVGVGGLTVMPALGRGKGERPTVEEARGTSRRIAQFNSLDTIIIVVDDSKVDTLIDAITSAASTGSKGDGKIFICPIEESVDIGTKEKGPQAL